MNWDDDSANALSDKQKTQQLGKFVVPMPIVPHRMEILPPEAHAIDMPMPATAQSVTRGSHLDRAQGFRHKMLPVAIVAGVLAGIAAVSLFGVPWLSFTLLMWFFTVFCLTWLGGFALDMLVSADGAAIIQVLGMYRILSREQKARLRRMERED